MLFMEVLVGFLPYPSVGMKCITLYGNSMHFEGSTEFQDGQQETALAIAL